MEQAGKARKLGKGLSGLIGVPVAVPLPPQGGDHKTTDKTPNNINITAQNAYTAPTKAAAVSAPAARPAVDAAQGGGVVLERGAGSAAMPYVVVRVSEVVANRFQPRQDFEPVALAALAASIKRDGVMQPLVVRKSKPDAKSGGTGAGAKWELIAGERRWRAAQLAGLTDVPAVVVDVPDVTAAMWAVVENVQRVDLGPLEKSHAYARLSKDFGLTQAEISEQVGEDRTLVSHYIRLGELEESVIGLIRAGKLTFGHGKVLNSPMVKPGVVREKLAARAARETLSVRQLEQLVQRGAGESEADVDKIAWTPRLIEGYEDASFEQYEKLDQKGREYDARVEAQQKAEARAAQFEARANVRDLEEQIGKHLGTKVKIKTSGGGKRGVLAIEFFSLDHFDGLVAKMGVKRIG